MATILGTSGNDSLIGTAASDVIAGFGGDDWLDDGGAGPDEMIGSTGNDTYVVAAPGDSIVEYAGEGTDTVRTKLPQFVLPRFLERLLYTGSASFTGLGNAEDNFILGGAGDDVLDGGDGADYLVGGAGNDRLLGGTGAPNQLQGGAGNDVYEVAAAGDSIIEFVGEGSDQVRTALAAYRLPANVEQLIYTGAAAFSGLGNALDNLIVGGAGDDVLDGAEGRDYLVGGEGNDRLIGGAGVANQLQGGLGDDVYYVSADADTALEFANEGLDQVRTTLAAYTLRSNFEQLVFIGTGSFVGTGNDLDNVIIGGASDDRLFGGLGVDTLAGGAGNDTLIGGTGEANTLIGGDGNDIYLDPRPSETIVEDVGGGIDTVRTRSSSYTLGGNLENLEFIGNGTFAGTGNALNNGIIGGFAADTLAGLSGNDRLAGGGGDDLLLGGVGSDTLLGGDGNDRLDGQDDADVLYSSPGIDQLIGGAGDDRYFIDHEGQQLIETSAGGHDSVVTSLRVFVLPDDVEDVAPVYTHTIATGVEIEFYSDLREVTGNASANRIQCGQNGTIMRGLDGDDTLLGFTFSQGSNLFIGGNGADFFDFVDSDDRIRYEGGENGIDHIGTNSSSHFTVELSRAFFTPTANVTIEQGPSTLPTTSNSTFFYNTSNGILHYDVDGNGPAAAIALFQTFGGVSGLEFTFYG